jgi:hypothetical protein
LTSQAVPPDENRWIEQFGCTQRYRHFRNGVRQHYRDHYPLLPSARANPRLNPGLGGVSRLCHEPRVALAVLEQMLAHPRSAGKLEVRLKREPVAVETDGDRALAVTLRNLETAEIETITADYVLDATELVPFQADFDKASSCATLSVNALWQEGNYAHENLHRRSGRGRAYTLARYDPEG